MVAHDRGKNRATSIVEQRVRFDAIFGECLIGRAPAAYNWRGPSNTPTSCDCFDRFLSLSKVFIRTQGGGERQCPVITGRDAFRRVGCWRVLARS